MGARVSVLRAAIRCQGARRKVRGAMAQGQHGQTMPSPAQGCAGVAVSVWRGAIECQGLRRARVRGARVRGFLPGAHGFLLLSYRGARLAIASRQKRAVARRRAHSDSERGKRQIQ
jgi:hypothetical protein